jgi:integrase
MPYDFSNITESSDRSYTRTKSRYEKGMAVSHYQKMLKAIRRNPGNILNMERDYIIFVIMGNMGLRIGEAVILKKDNFENLDMDLPRANVVNLKKREVDKMQKEICVHPKIKILIQKYIRKFVPKGEKYLFPGRAKKGSVSKKIKDKGHISIRQVQRLFYHYCRICKFKEKYSSHGMRHMYASYIYSKTKDQAFVRDQLGHASIQGFGGRVSTSTNNYINISPERARELIEEVGAIL